MKGWMSGAKGAQKFGGCFWCLVPQGLCERWESVGDKGGFRQRAGGSCQYADTLFQVFVVLWMFDEPKARGWLEEWMVENDIRTKEKAQVWLGERVVWGDVEGNRLCDLVVYFLDRDL